MVQRDAVVCTGEGVSWGDEMEQDWKDIKDVKLGGGGY